MADYESDNYNTGQDYSIKNNLQKFESYYSTYKSISEEKEAEEIYEDLLKVRRK